MNPFEIRFRRKFEPLGERYRFRRWGGQITFSRDEYAEFVAQFRQIWCNPVVWGTWLMLGLVVPALLYRAGSEVIAPALAAVTWITLIVLLAYIYRKPDAAARVLSPGPRPRQADAPRGFPWFEIFYLAVFGWQMAKDALDPATFWPSRAGWAAALATFLAVTVARLWRWIRDWRADLLHR